MYHDQLGTVSSTHYTRYCRKRNCSYQQHYGYYTEGDGKKSTWEPSDKIPPSLINEFESGMKSVVTDNVSTSGLGQKIHTRIIVSDNEGYKKSIIDEWII